MNTTTKRYVIEKTMALFLMSAILGSVGAADGADGLPPFRIRYEVPADGLSAIAIDDADGRRVKNVEAQIPRSAGPAQIAWDLKDDYGNYVEPGTYRFKTLVMPRPELYYRHTVTPNIENYWDDRVPWSTNHSGVHGWSSDFGGINAITTRIDRVYFGSGCSEAGEAFTEIDLDGKRHWGYHWFGGWIGLQFLAADEDAVYVIDTRENLWRKTSEPRHEMTRIVALNTETRRGYANAIAARDGELFISFAPYRINWLGHVNEANLFDNVTLPGTVDAEHSLPLYEKDPPKKRLKPNPRFDFLRLLRLPPRWNHQNREDVPPGGNQRPDPRKFNASWPIYLQTPPGREARQHIVVAFKQDVPIGSIAFPYPVDPEWFDSVEFSVLKPSAPYPPRPNEEGDWIPFDAHGKPGAWNVVAAPAGTLTRALRVTFNRSDAVAADTEWVGWMEGMKMLNRRFVNHALDARIRVNSGTVDAFGVWDAERERPLTRKNPGIYVMEWQKSRNISGLAFKEIDGAITEIDVWTGPANAPVDLGSDEHWRNVAVYRQARRWYSQATNRYNPGARYLDGYVDIRDDGKRPVATRAIRLRVVEQWMHPGMRNNMGVRPDRGGRTLDTRRCRIFGVAAVEHIGGEIIDELMYQRLAVYNGATGELLREFPFYVAERSLHFHPDGRLMALNAGHDRLIAIDTKTGATTEVMRFPQPPQQITFGPDGLVYAFMGDTHRPIWQEFDFAVMGGHRHLERPVRDPAAAPFRVYDLNGRLIKEIGTPGRIESGFWDSTRVGRVNDMTVDRQGSLWVATADPHKRIVRFDTNTGEMTGEFFGNTAYGGGGSFNRYDASRVFLGDSQFEIDDKTNRSQMYSQMGTSGGSYVAVRVNGRTYLADAPLKLGKIPSDYVNIYLYDEETGSARLVAAFGHAVGFEPVRQGSILEMLGGQAPLGVSFTWSDLNGNGQVDPDEIKFEPVDVTPRWAHQGFRDLDIGFIDDQLNAVARNAEYVVTKFLPNGVPMYERRERSFSANFRFRDGNYLVLQSDHRGRLENLAVDPEGRRIWGYPVHSPGVTGLGLPDYIPGRVTNQYGNIIGHGVSDEGDLGEFFVTNHNTGQWLLWTSDGLLAGEIFQHKFFPGVQFFNSFEKSYPGMRLDPMSLNQEHFNGYFAKCEKTGKYYAVVGFTFVGLVEVRGFERARRMNMNIQVTAEDIARAREWEAAQIEVATLAKEYKMTAQRLEKAPSIDGKIEENEWPEDTSILDGQLSFRIGYDNDNLYLCYTTDRLGVIGNTGEDFRSSYTTGSAFDFFLGTHPSASADRREPAIGDLRLLTTFVADQPRVVLYQAKAGNANPAERWYMYSPAAGELAMDRVVVVEDASVAKMEEGNRATVEAAIPLRSIGLKIQKDMKLKMDWGMLVSTDGRTVQRRVYWANQSATGTGDVVAEGRFMPQAWGQIVFE